MNKTLGGIVWSYNGLSQDYCLKESILSLKECCDEVVVLDAGSTDGTAEFIKQFEDYKTKVILLDNSEWVAQTGKEKLNYFQNVALKHLSSDYYYLQQADEILHESSYKWLRIAIEQGAEAYLCKRVNLWQSPYLQLSVPQNRMPCSPIVIRLAKNEYLSYGDGESIAAPAQENFIEYIKIYHMGFVRKRDIMKQKVIHIQEEVFGVNHDVKLDGSDVFIPQRWFDPEKDLIPIDEPLPKIIQEWAAERVYPD